jgi:hypothetical protein
VYPLSIAFLSCLFHPFHLPLLSASEEKLGMSPMP